MTEDIVAICCDHSGGRLLPPGHRAGKGSVVLDNWVRESVGWSSLYEANVVAPYGLDARAEHERRVINDESRSGAKLVDGRGRIRLRGGITRTRRGYRFECPACPLDVVVRSRTLFGALDSARDAGVAGVTLMQLQSGGVSASGGKS